MDILLKALGALGGRKFLVTVGVIIYQVIQQNNGQVNWGIIAPAVGYVVAQAFIDYASGGVASTSTQVLSTAQRERSVTQQNAMALAQKIIAARGPAQEVPPPPATPLTPGVQQAINELQRH